MITDESNYGFHLVFLIKTVSTVHADDYNADRAALFCPPAFAFQSPLKLLLAEFIELNLLL